MVEGHLAQELLKAWSSYVAYAVAFIYVGVIWLNHHYLFDRLFKVDFTTNLINLGIIGTAALIPFPTGVLAGAFRDGDIADQRSAVLLYPAIASLMSVVAWLPALWHLFGHTELAKPQMPRAALAVEVTRPIVGIILYAVAAVVGWFFSPTIAVFIFMLVVAFYAWSSRGILSRQDWAETVMSDVARQRGPGGPLSLPATRGSISRHTRRRRQFSGSGRPLLASARESGGHYSDLRARIGV